MGQAADAGYKYVQTRGGGQPMVSPFQASPPVGDQGATARQFDSSQELMHAPKMYKRTNHEPDCAFAAPASFQSGEDPAKGTSTGKLQGAGYDGNK
jgi:hypothetical protein